MMLRFLNIFFFFFLGLLLVQGCPALLPCWHLMFIHLIVGLWLVIAVSQKLDWIGLNYRYYCFNFMHSITGT